MSTDQVIAKEQAVSSTATNSPGRSPWLRPKLIGWIAVATVLVIAALSTKVVSIEEVAAGDAPTFDAAEFAEETFLSEVVPQIESEAVDLATLLSDLAAGADPADFGNSPGQNSSFAFPVTLTAVAGTPTEPLLPLVVQGVPAEISVVLQIGPALNGTAIRDVTGTVSFDQFADQLEYQRAGTELNNQVRDKILAGIDTTALAGKTLQITGAFVRVNPAFVSIVPTRIEVLP